MFSSFSSLIPAAFTGGNSNDKSRQSVVQTTPFTPDDDDDDDKQLGADQGGDLDELGVKKREGKKDKDKGPSETFIFVRPPPSKSNHPLNLQVQLVPPQSPPPGGVSQPTA
jgi:hypothetical protein